MAVAVRLVAVGLLVAGPWTDEAAELAGWDAERFQEIAERDGSAWVDQPIEYPPGSVVVLDRLAGDDVVATNRRLVVLSALVEGLAVVALWRTVSPRAAKAFLLLGLPLVPMGMLRLDMVVTVLAVVAVLALLGNRSPGVGGAGSAADPDDHHGDRRHGRRPVDDGDRPNSNRQAAAAIAFAGLVTLGAMIKIWPALLITGAWAAGRRMAAIAAAVVTAMAGLVWLLVVGDGIEPLRQVLSLRGATGWHVESLPGALVALLTDSEPRLELNAFRIGTLNPAAVTVGRAVAVAMIVALTSTAPRRPTSFTAEAALDDARRRFCLVVLGSVAALIITAPLLSPQFLLWLTPWGALLVADRHRIIEPAGDTVMILLVVALVLTGVVLGAFGPDGLGRPLPAFLLTLRNLSLLALPPACLVELRRITDPTAGRPARPTERRAAVDP